MAREVHDELEIFGVNVMKSELSQRVAYIDAMKHGVSVTQYSPGSKAAEEIETLCDELLQSSAPIMVVEDARVSYAEPIEEEDPEVRQPFDEQSYMP